MASIPAPDRKYATTALAIILNPTGEYTKIPLASIPKHHWKSDTKTPLVSIPTHHWTVYQNPIGQYTKTPLDIISKPTGENTNKNPVLSTCDLVKHQAAIMKHPLNNAGGSFPVRSHGLPFT
jgi:hypothetical protein